MSLATIFIPFFFFHIFCLCSTTRSPLIAKPIFKRKLTHYFTRHFSLSSTYKGTTPIVLIYVIALYPYLSEQPPHAVESPARSYRIPYELCLCKYCGLFRLFNKPHVDLTRWITEYPHRTHINSNLPTSTTNSRVFTKGSIFNSQKKLTWPAPLSQAYGTTNHWKSV